MDTTNTPIATIRPRRLGIVLFQARNIGLKIGSMLPGTAFLLEDGTVKDATTRGI
jgi:hypothetical protein